MSAPAFVHLPACPAVTVTPTTRVLAHQLPVAPTVVLDGAVAAGHPGLVEELGARNAKLLTLDAGRRFDLLVGDVLDARAAGEVRELVAVGGGTVMDAVKLAATIPSWARDVWTLRLDNGLGRVGVPREWRSSVPVVCVPTTLGTSSETNGAAVFRTADGFSLVQGPALVPQRAFVSGELLASLTQAQRRQGVWEILMRALGPYVWGPGALGYADTSAVAVVHSLVPTLMRAGPVHDEELCDLVVLGAETQRSTVNVGRSVYSHPLWALANELAHLGRVSKMSAVLAAIPGWVHLLRAGPRFGLIDRLAECLEAAGLGVEEFTELARQDADHVGWLSDIDPGELVARMERRWRPMGYPEAFAEPWTVRTVLAGATRAPEAALAAV